mmetsp:Transcript_105793/g.341169  ORF Transcript_105793/g.341169 Transcript_105793/m.341169 type:complete len:321 (+) Transcript_105793:112-1074(+)
MAAREHFDIIIVGGGLSGIGAAYRVATMCPSKSYILLEGRDDLGGTWDLWRYPGVRSDSDMYTLAYPFDLWKSNHALAEGSEIKEYLGAVAKRHGIVERMRFGSRAQRAEYDSKSALWSLDTSRGSFTCNFLYLCTGYYQYDEGFVPDYPGVSNFAGRLVHPMRWPADLDVTGKRVVVIGSGATAISLAPELAKTASHVKLLQRSPSFLVASPRQEGPLFAGLHKIAPTLAAKASRWKNVLFAMTAFKVATTFPDKAKGALIGDVMKAMPGQDKKTLHSEVQSMGAATLRSGRRRPLRGCKLRRRFLRHRPHRRVCATGH